MPKERVYGTPTGIAGGPSEKASKATDRKVAKPASDAQVHQALKDTRASDAAWAKGREAPARTSSSKAAGNAPSSLGYNPTDVVDALKNRAKKIDEAVDSAAKGG